MIQRLSQRNLKISRNRDISKLCPEKNDFNKTCVYVYEL
jgi:hypothetical protein